MKSAQVKASFLGMANLPLTRQLVLLLGLAMSIALAIYIALWFHSLGYPSPVAGSTRTITAMSPVPARHHAQAKQVGSTNPMTGNGDTRVLPTPGVESGPAIAFGDKRQIWGVGWQLLGGLIAILVLLGVMRPLMRHLASAPAAKQAADTVEGGMEQVIVSDEGALRSSQTNDDELNLEFVKAMVSQEPKRVAQVVKLWLTEI